MKELKASLETMQRRIVEILECCDPSVYVYGSLTLGDFRPGWSDIDILVLTGEKIPEAQARQLVGLRETMLEEDPENPFYRSFEGGMLSLEAFLSGKPDRVVYWGTSGERITDTYRLDAFCRSELLDSGILLFGNELRGRLSRPTYEELKAEVRRHYETIRQYARKTERNFYSFGWFLDISRGLYTLRTGKIIAKTAAGEWALREKLCPCPDVLEKVLEIRREPERYRGEEPVLTYAETLGDSVQSYADVLERELAG